MKEINPGISSEKVSNSRSRTLPIFSIAGKFYLPVLTHILRVFLFLQFSPIFFWEILIRFKPEVYKGISMMGDEEKGRRCHGYDPDYIKFLVDEQLRKSGALDRVSSSTVGDSSQVSNYLASFPAEDLQHIRFMNCADHGEKKTAGHRSLIDDKSHARSQDRRDERVRESTSSKSSAFRSPIDVHPSSASSRSEVLPRFGMMGQDGIFVPLAAAVSQADSSSRAIHPSRRSPAHTRRSSRARSSSKDPARHRQRRHSSSRYRDAGQRGSTTDSQREGYRGRHATSRHRVDSVGRYYSPLRGRRHESYRSHDVRADLQQNRGASRGGSARHVSRVTSTIVRHEPVAACTRNSSAGQGNPFRYELSRENDEALYIWDKYGKAICVIGNDSTGNKPRSTSILTGECSLHFGFTLVKVFCFFTGDSNKGKEASKPYHPSRGELMDMMSKVFAAQLRERFSNVENLGHSSTSASMCQDVVSTEVSVSRQVNIAVQPAAVLPESILAREDEQTTSVSSVSMSVSIGEQLPSASAACQGANELVSLERPTNTCTSQAGPQVIHNDSIPSSIIEPEACILEESGSSRRVFVFQTPIEVFSDSD